eukprot:jgi/Tetstr1/457092/TSEL_000333.t1
MDNDTFNMSMRKFLKQVGVTSQQALEAHVRDADVFETACAEAGAGRFSAGDLVWSRRTDVVSLALVLEPEVPPDRAVEMLFLAMVAANDALGAITPPETALTFLWPDVFKVNGATVGQVRLATSDEVDEDGAPLWLVVALDFRLAPLDGPLEPGETPDRTSLIDEGAVDLDRTQAPFSDWTRVANLLLKRDAAAGGDTLSLKLNEHL